MILTEFVTVNNAVTQMINLMLAKGPTNLIKLKILRNIKTL